MKKRRWSKERREWQCGENHYWYGKTRSEETKKKISDSQNRRYASMELLDARIKRLKEEANATVTDGP